MVQRSLTVALVVASLGLGAGRVDAGRRYKVKIDSVPQQAAIYLEAIEGGVQAHTPHVLNLERGAYTIILVKDGYQSLTRKIDVKRATTLSLTLVKQPSSPARVTLEPAPGSPAAGAEVRVNGKQVGQLPITITLQPGRYLVEVSKPGFESFSQWIDISQSEQRAIPIDLKSTAPTTGTLLVAANIIGAEVLLDGRKLEDTAPALIEGLAAGKHVVEVRAAGHLASHQEVDVVAGKTIKLTLDLTPDQQSVARSSGTLQVLASHKGVEILVDGATRGMAPLKVEGLAAGSHVIEGRKEGMVPAEQTVEISKGELKTIKLALAEAPIVRRTGSVRVVSPVLGAMVFVDGRYVGKTPHVQHSLDPGPHFVTVRKEGYREQVRTVEVKANQIAQIEAPLDQLPPKEPDPGKLVKRRQPPADDPDRTRGLASYSAEGVPPSFFTTDLSAGYPYLFEGRLTTGFFSGRHLGMDGGVELRTFGAVSEIGLHTRLRLLRSDPFATALFFALGGGGGPSSRNTFYANFGVAGSMHFKRRVTFSGRAFFNVYTDRVCPERPGPGELSACAAPPISTGLKVGEARDRLGGVRLFLSAVLEVALSRHVNLLAIFEGAPFQGGRQLLTDPFAELMPVSDPATYFRLGVSIKR